MNAVLWSRPGWSGDRENVPTTWQLWDLRVMFSMASVKIPLTVFAFAGGALAIGLGLALLREVGRLRLEDARRRHVVRHQRRELEVADPADTDVLRPPSAATPGVVAGAWSPGRAVGAATL